MMPTATVTDPPRTYSKHGLSTLKATMKALGSRAIDRRTRTGKALVAWRLGIAADLGGFDALSMQQRAVLEEAVKLKLLLDSIDGWILAQPSLIDRRKRALLPVVRERQSLADALVRYLSLLGLERRAKDPLDLNTYLQAKTPTPGSHPVMPARAADGTGLWVGTANVTQNDVVVEQDAAPPPDPVPAPESACTDEGDAGDGGPQP